MKGQEKKETRVENTGLDAQQKASQVKSKGSLPLREQDKIITSKSLMLAVKVKSPAKRAFLYDGVKDLQNLCNVVGFTPKMDFTPNGIGYSFGKKFPTILNDSKNVVIIDANGSIEQILSFDRFNEIFDIEAQREIEISDFAKEKK